MTHLAHLWLCARLGIGVSEDEGEDFVLVSVLIRRESVELEGWVRVNGRDGDVISELNVLVRRRIGDGDAIGRSEIIKDLVDDRAQEEDVSDRVCGSKLVATDGMLIRIVWKGGCHRVEGNDSRQHKHVKASHAAK